jgi:hypothetical protein
MNRRLTMTSIALAVTATALAAAGTANAETIYLSCVMSGGNGEQHTVDVSSGSVDNHPASINATSIDWSFALGSGSPGLTGTMYSHIDRTSGVLTERIAYVYNGRQMADGHNTGTCSVGAAPAVKF